MNIINNNELLFEIQMFLSNELQQKKNFKILNKYIIEEVLVFVFFVEDKSDSSKKYAIKASSIFNSKIGDIDQDKLKKCKVEAEMMRKCIHKNVVDVHSDFEIGFYHFIQFNDCIYFLDDQINYHLNQISNDQFLHYANQIIDGVEYLHKRGNLLGFHFVKNILITNDGMIKICNFGFQNKFDDGYKIKDLNYKNAKSQFIFFPPEIIEDMNNSKQNINLTIEGDIWSLGICLSLLGGSNMTDFTHNSNQESQTHDQSVLVNKVNKLVNYILNIDPLQRPSVQEIRQKLNQSFFYNKNGESFLESNQNDNKYTQLNEINIERLIDFNSNLANTIYEKYLQYVKVQPQNIDILITLGYIEVKYHSNFYDAKQYFNKCIELNPYEIDAYLGLCLNIIEQKEFKNYKLAYEYVEYCLKIRNDYWRVFYIKSWLLFELDREKEGYEVLKKGQNLKSDSIQLLSLEILFLNLKCDQKSYVLREKVINLNTDFDPIIFFRIGKNFMENKIYKNRSLARSNFLQSHKYNSRHIYTNLYLYIMYKNDNLKESQKYFQILQLDSENSFLLWQLGNFEKDKNLKLKLYQEALKYDEENRDAYYSVAELLKEQNKYDDAIKEFEKVLKFKPYDTEAINQIGYIIGFQKKEYLKALQYYKILIKQNPDDTDVLNQIGALYYFLQDYEKSIFYQKQCEQIDSENDYAIKCLKKTKKII